ncbi:MAG: disulfide bond formation protein B [Candidatus Pacebacteria bacterium]|nr:disulfide bond formation protein B [Candidatus Paceibacterota bacterium]
MNIYLYQYLVSWGVLLLQIALLVLGFLYLIKKNTWIAQHLRKHGMGYAFGITFICLLGSLGFSQIFHYEPCLLCWYQRIFHFPQVVLFGLAFFYKDSRVWLYSLWLSFIGLLIAIYHILVQYSPIVAKTSICNTASVHCEDILTQSFGYITVPVMSATIFVVLIVLAVINLKK